MKLGRFTLIVPYYRAPLMLAEQLRHWADYPPGVDFIVVDDGSPEPAIDVIREADPSLIDRLRLFRIAVDIPWNRGGARNLGAKHVETEWLVHIDIDHVLSAASAALLLQAEVNGKHWYRFERFRNGVADATRRKDPIADGVTFGRILPHMDSYLCTWALYWLAGGYDEDYSGCLGGGSPFLKQLTKVGGAPRMAPPDVHLSVYTRSVISDASVHTLSRVRGEYQARQARKVAAKRTIGVNPLRFPWQEIAIP